MITKKNRGEGTKDIPPFAQTQKEDWSESRSADDKSLEGNKGPNNIKDNNPREDDNTCPSWALFQQDHIQQSYRRRTSTNLSEHYNLPSHPTQRKNQDNPACDRQIP